MWIQKKEVPDYINMALAYQQSDTTSNPDSDSDLRLVKILWWTSPFQVPATKPLQWSHFSFKYLCVFTTVTNSTPQPAYPRASSKLRMDWPWSSYFLTFSQVIFDQHRGEFPDHDEELYPFYFLGHSSPLKFHDRRILPHGNIWLIGVVIDFGEQVRHCSQVTSAFTRFSTFRYHLGPFVTFLKFYMVVQDTEFFR